MIIIYPTFIMLVGLVASGKSTIAKEFKDQGYKIVSSDDIREELFDDINCQDNNSLVFETLHSRIKHHLLDGKNCVYDATNVSYKKRMAFLQQLNNIPCKKICYLIATPYEECLRRNSLRDRKVPEHVIKKMYFNFNIPYYYEGWDDIVVIKNPSSSTLISWCDMGEFYYNYDQKNSHHNNTLGLHMNNAYNYIINKSVDCYTAIATMLHDIGKPNTQTFYNSKGEKTDEAHYYNHQYVGAYDSLFYDYGEDEGYEPCLEVAIRIMWHMQPYFIKTQKCADKYKKFWGQRLTDDIMLIHEADICAH